MADLRKQNHIRNTVFNALGEGFWGFGMAFHNINSVIPVFLAQMGAPAWLIGLIPGGFILLLALPQLVSATLFRNIVDIKRLNILGHLSVIPFLLGLVWFFFIHPTSGKTGIWIYMLCFTFYALAIGLLIPVWADFLASITLASRRGRFFGITFTSNAILGMLGGYVLKVILEQDRFSFPANFGFGWLIMALATLLGTVLFLPLVVIHKPQASQAPGHWMQRIRGIYGRDRNYRRYIYSRMFVASAYMPLAFYAIDLQDRYDLPLSSTGTFTFFIVAGTAVFNYLLGYLGDTRGRKTSVAFYYIGNILAVLTALLGRAPWTAYLVFVFIGLSFGASQSSFMVFVYEFAGARGDRKLYYAALDTAVAPVLCLYISLAGTFVEHFGTGPLYVVSLVLMGIGLGVLLFAVKAPQAIPEDGSPPAIPEIG